MPAIVQDPGILAAARSAIEILLQFKGQAVVLQRRMGTPVLKPGGGHDFGDPLPVLSQTFAWSQVGDDILEDGSDGDTPVVKRNYVLTGRYDADLLVKDTWQDDEATYLVESVNQSSGFKTHADVVGFVKVS